MCMILNVSSLGKVVAQALQIMCEFYNLVMIPTLEITWCYLLMPCVMALLQMIQALASLGGQVSAAYLRLNGSSATALSISA